MKYFWISFVWAALVSGCGFTNEKSSTSVAGASGNGSGSAPVTGTDPTTGTGTTPVTPTLTATYTQVNQQILQPLCISCHGSGSSPDFSSYSSFAQNTAYVVPGNPTGSAIYTETESGSMPRGGTALTSTQLGLIYSWIEAGAQND